MNYAPAAITVADLPSLIDPEVGEIYLLQMGLDGPIKIGFTNKPVKQRVRALQTGCPWLLCLLGTMPGTFEEEGGLHRLFAHWKMNGEWFDPSGLRDLIERLPPTRQNLDLRSERTMLEVYSEKGYCDFGLCRGYPVYTNPYNIKLTSELRMDEFLRATSIQAALTVDPERPRVRDLQDAYSAVEHIWGRRPDWNFGDCCRAQLKAA